MEWLAPVAGLVGVLVGVLISEYRQWLERREKYQAMVFPKRLEVHQEAYNLCHKLMLSLHLLKLSKEKDPSSSYMGVRAIYDWWPLNCLYLDETSANLVVAVMRLSTHKIDSILESRTNDSLDKQLDDLFTKSFTAIAKGVGVKYMPEATTTLSHDELIRLLTAKPR